MRHAKRDYLLGGVPLWQTNYREILRLAKLGYSQRSIAASAGCARSTVQRVLERAGSNPHTLEELLALTDKGIQQALFPASSIPSTRKPPDYERVHRELAKNGVTLSLLWNEYCEECYASKELPLMYTQFCLHYREYAQQTKATMHLDHKPTAKVTDPETGSQTPAYLFIAVLSCSGYAYVEAFGDQGQESLDYRARPRLAQWWTTCRKATGNISSGMGNVFSLGQRRWAPHQGSDPRDAFKPEGGTAILPGVHGASEVGGQIFLNQAGVRLWTGSPVYRLTQLQNHPNDPQNGQRPSPRGTGNKRRVLRFHQGRGLLRRG